MNKQNIENEGTNERVKAGKTFSCYTQRLISAKAFTLAEVLITLGIIGVVSALILPSFIAKYQKHVLKQQFKKSYSMLQQAVRKSEADIGFTPGCHYWDGNPYGGAYCSKYNEANKCIEWRLYKNDSPLPADYNGLFNECALLTEYMEKNLKIAKTCNGNSITDGCMPPYAGNDTVTKTNKPDISDDALGKRLAGCEGWLQANMNNKKAYVLTNGVILFSYSNKGESGFKVTAVDVNGKKGPNKWGHDVFVFHLNAGKNTPLKVVPAGGCAEIEEGGVSTADMLKNLYK